MRAILTLHSVDESKSTMSIAPGQLRSLVRSIQRSDHSIVRLRELLDDPAEDRRIALTFDDGIASVHEHALPILAEHGATATLFVVSEHVGRDTRWRSLPNAEPYFPTMPWGRIEELAAAGWDVGSHTATHPILPRLSRAQIEDEMVRCDHALEERLGKRPRLFAYPYGRLDSIVADLASNIYEFSVTTRMSDLPARIDEPHLVPRLEVYYFRQEIFHRSFGSAGFRAYLRARAVVRGLRGG